MRRERGVIACISRSAQASQLTPRVQLSRGPSNTHIPSPSARTRTRTRRDKRPAYFSKLLLNSFSSVYTIRDTCTPLTPAGQPLHIRTHRQRRPIFAPVSTRGAPVQQGFLAAARLLVEHSSFSLNKNQGTGSYHLTQHVHILPETAAGCCA